MSVEEEDDPLWMRIVTNEILWVCIAALLILGIAFTRMVQRFFPRRMVPFVGQIFADGGSGQVSERVSYFSLNWRLSSSSWNIPSRVCA